jgi:hypothetical protein
MTGLKCMLGANGKRAEGSEGLVTFYQAHGACNNHE